MRQQLWRIVFGLTATSWWGCGGCADDSDVQHGDAFVERDGMVLVPAGSFWRGCNAEIGDRCESRSIDAVLYNRPDREVMLAEFWIDRYEVTVEEYRSCGEGGGCTEIGGVAWNEFPPPDVPNLPVTGVSWKQADAYCSWTGKRLPTEAEWEKAARGTDGRRYPWGNDIPECGHAHLLIGEECRTRHVLPVDEHPSDISPYGAIGMIGNVQEWVRDWAARDYYEYAPSEDPPGPEREAAYRDTYKVVRGGYFDTTPEAASVSLRRWGRWESGYPGRIGFRCARSEAP